MLNKNVVNYMGCDCGYEEADLVLFGAPFDSTTSFRPGTRFAGGAIRSDSYGLELYSPYQDRTLEACRIFDMGDLGARRRCWARSRRRPGRSSGPGRGPSSSAGSIW